MKTIEGESYANLIIIILALLSVTIHLLVLNNLEYHRDELLYFSLGQHPAFGYATVPPMTGWIAWLMKTSFGFSLFAVRFFPAMMSGVMVILVSSLASELGGGFYSRILAAIGFIISVYTLRTFGLFQPVHTDLFFWTLIIYLIVRYINANSEKYLILVGIAAGFSFLNKYLPGLLLICLLVVIPFTQYRRVFKSKMLFIGILVGFLIFLPNIIWQMVHGFPVTNHMSELVRTQLNNVNRSTFLFEQLLMPAAGSVLTVAGMIFLLSKKDVKKFRFLGITAVFVIAILLLLRGKSYYTLGVFPFLTAAGAVSYERLIKRWWIRILFPAFLILLTIPVVPLGLPVYKTAGLIKYFHNLESKYGLYIGRRFEDGSIHSLPQDYADMLGWEELTSVAAKAYNMIEDKKAAFVYCENYGQAGAITVIGKKYALPEAVSFNESFRYWIPRVFMPDIKSMIYINREPGEDVKKLFRKITVAGSITNPDAREFGTKVFLCEDPVVSFNEFWKIRIGHL